MLRRHMSISPPFKKIMAANRGEIATRILRAGNELGCKTVSDAFRTRLKLSFQCAADNVFVHMNFCSLGCMYLTFSMVV